MWGAQCGAATGTGTLCFASRGAFFRPWQSRLSERVEIHKVWQYYFFNQWLALRRYANDRGVRVIGDMPIYVASDSADVWVARDLFLLDDQHRREVCCRTPRRIQYVWPTVGNPLYNWRAMADRDFDWWVLRFRQLLEMVDVIRIDHFRGFEKAYRCIPAHEETGRNGEWVKADGSSLFSLDRKLGRGCLLSPRTWGRSQPRWQRCVIDSVCPACGCCSSVLKGIRLKAFTCRTTTMRIASFTRALTITTQRNRGSASCRLCNRTWRRST